MKLETSPQCLIPSAPVLWMTGLSGAGKTTLAMALKQQLIKHSKPCIVLDGDELRTGINADLGFSDEHRRENARRIAHVAKLLSEHGNIVVVAVIAPRRADRLLARSIVGSAFLEVYVGTSLRACEERDPKGLYKRARQGQIETFTGVSAVYEPPEAAEICIDTETMTVENEVQQVIAHLARLQAA